MSKSRAALYAGLSFAVLSVAMIGSVARAADEAPSDGAAVEEVVITGSRSAARSKLDTVAPVDVVTSAQISRGGTTELAQSLAFALPSLNFTRPAVTDGTDTVRPATLRGLSPDETLVLVNSKRRHAASLVNLNGSIGYGSGAVDLNTIPTAAIGSVEVLRDGASAQYGSDAIAGVINLRLREASSGGSVTASYGQRDTFVKTRPSVSPVPGVVLKPNQHRNDGETSVVSGWAGLPLFGSGFLTISGEAKVADHTVRAGPDPRQQYAFIAPGVFDPRELTYNRYNNWYGDPDITQYTLFANAGYDVGGVHFYGWGSYQFRDAISAANVRRSIQENAGSNITSVYPNGFLPKIEGRVYDTSLAIGADGKAGDWDWDASVVYGRNKFHFGVIDSINASMGPSSPHQFDAGSIAYQQTVGNIGVTRPLEFGGFTSATLAGGVEVRWENYQIKAGEPASYINGGYFTQPGVLGGTGSQAFQGFAPANATDQSRTSESAYVDLEVKPTDALDVDMAVRGEHYSDFGSVVTGKLSARYDFSGSFAVRGSVSNGFRAPSLQQSYITTLSTNFVGGNPVNTILLPPTDPRAALIGATALKPEKSTNLSGGGVFRAGGFSLTVDAYYIKITDRIVLSDILQQANVIALFGVGSGIGGVRFFTNGVDSETKGIEAVAAYKWRPDWGYGTFDFTASFSHNETKLTRVQSTPILSGLVPPPAFLPHYRTATLTDGQPKDKGAVMGDWENGPLGVTLKANYYGKVLQPANNSNALGDYWLQPKIIVDLEARLMVAKGWQVAVGADNLLDTYPTTPPYVLNGVTLSSNGVGAFPEYSPYGFQGRFVYVRATYSW